MYPDGRKYTGEWANHEFHGKGTFEWPDGRKYTGRWEKSKPHGAGVYINAKKEEIHCKWLDGKIISENASELKELQKALGR